jgi:hypothetical protein
MSADCHVRKLRIRTGDKTILPRMTFVFEDAFRTASFPGIPPNGRVFIKRLDLGRSLSSVSSRVLAAKLDEELRRIRPVMISRNMKEDIAAPAVWFPDELSPHRFLLDLLSKNHRPRAWYWKTAIKGWSPSLTRRQSYQLILAQAAEHETGIRGLAFVLEPLYENGNLLDILDALEPREVSRLLIGMGLPPLQEIHKGNQANHGKIFPPVSLRDGAIVTRAAGTWSVFDPRFMLVSYLVLTRMDQKPNPFQVNRLLAAVSGLPSFSREILQPAMERTQPSPDAEIEESLRTSSESIGEKTGEAGAPTADMRVSETTARGMNSPQGISRKPDPGSSEKAHEENPTAGQESEQVKAATAVFKEDESADGIFQTPKPIPASDGFVTSGSPATRPSESEPAGSRNLAKPNQSTPFKEHTLTEIWPFYGGFAGDISKHAGLIFIIPLMKRIGMDTLMESFPAYEDLELPRRILFRCAELLSIPTDDPVLGFLGEKPEPSQVIPEFAAPPEWRRILPPPASGAYDFRLGRIRGVPGYRLILDQKGLLTVGLWHPGNRDRIKPWIDRAQQPMGRAAPRTWSMDRLVDTLVIAMIRYCRQYASMGLKGLIRRPAYVATTKTHLDVSFPFNRLDIRVRMAGLDINPGWVPWLGRVFQFHYVGGEG